MSHSSHARQSQSSKATTISQGNNNTPAAALFPVPRTARIYSTDDELRAWRVDYDSITMLKPLAVGVFVEVWVASYGAETVAVKKLKPRVGRLYHEHPEMIDTGVLDDLVFEIRVLSRLNHPRIVAFYGVAWRSDSDILAVTEYMPQQDLRAFLTHRRHQHHQRGSESGVVTGSSSSMESSWSVEIVRMALCVAEALTCLHALEPPLVHGNVQARNVLLDAHMDSKLCDFGSAQYCHPPSLGSDPRTMSLSDTSRCSGSLGTLPSARADATPWIAPEVLRGVAICDPSMDMYAFGMLLSEIDTTEVPYDGMFDDRGAPVSDIDIRQQVAMGMLRPSFLPTCPHQILALAAQCVAFDPQDRPTSAEVASALREIGRGMMERPSQAMARVSQISQVSSAAGGRSTVGALLSLPSTTSSLSDTSAMSDASQRTIEFRRFDTPEQLLNNPY